MAEFKQQLECDNDDEDALTEASTVVGCCEDIPEYDAPLSTAVSGRQLQRIHWITVHSGSHRMTVAGLCGGGVRADGCHSTLDEYGNIVTYIHLSARCRQAVLSKYMEKTFRSESARVLEAVGELSLIATPEFQLLARHLTDQNLHFVSDGSVLGFLSKFARHKARAPSTLVREHPPATPLELENASLRQRVAVLEQDRLSMEERLVVALRDRARAEDEIGVLRRALSKAGNARAGCESELKRLRIENAEFRRLGAEEKEVRRLNRQLLSLQEDLSAKSRDCKALELILRYAREDNARLESLAAMAPRPSAVLKK